MDTKPIPQQRRRLPARQARRTGTPLAPRQQRQQGFALLLAMIALTILAVLVADLHETTGTSFAASVAERDQLKAEFLARSGVNLTRMLVAQERPLRTMLNTLGVGQILGGRIPQIPVWRFANMVLKPFANFGNSKSDAESAGFDLDLAEGIGDTGGTFEIVATAENGKLNVNHPRLRNDEMSRMSVAAPLYRLMAAPRFDPLFSAFDEKGRMSTRMDVVANIIDWWDIEDQRTDYDPTMGTIQSSGGEDADYYRDQTEPYLIKNAPFDTLEELRLVRGVSDDFWATFIEPDLEDPSTRQVTIWAGTSAAINPNEAEPEVMLARVCGYAEFKTQILCNDQTGVEPGKFVSFFRMLRAFVPVRIPLFSSRTDFMNFMVGKPTGLMEKITSMFGGGGGSGGLLGGGLAGGSGQTSNTNNNNNQGAPNYPFTALNFPQNPVNGVNPADFRKELERNFTVVSKFITIESIGRVGNVQRRLRTVVNFDTSWFAPPPNTAQAQPLGVFAYFRLEKPASKRKGSTMALILGIDIGNHSVRGALLRTSMRAFEVERYVEVPVAALSGNQAQRSLLADAVRELVQGLPSPPDSVMSCVDGMRGSLRIITIPVAARKRTAEVLPFELESLLPFPIEEAVIDYQEQGLREGQLALLTAAAPDTAVGEAMQLWDEAGVTPRELCIGALALEGALAFMVQPPDEAWLLVHVDDDQSDACVALNGKVELCRTFDEGASSLRGGSRAVHMALHQTVMKYRAEGGPQVRRLIVMGEPALDARIVAGLGEALGLSAEAFAPPASKQGQGMVSPVFGKALALAGRALRRGKRVDLRKGKYALPRGVNQLRGYALLAGLCTLALVSSYTFSVWAEYRVLSQERDALSLKLEQVTQQHFGEKTSSVTRARELLDGGGKPKDPLPRFDAFRVLGVISGAVQSGVLHDTRKLEITFDEGGQTGKFELQGQIPDLAARDAVATAIEAHDCIEQLERGKTSTTPGQDRKSYLLEGVIACPGAQKKTKGGQKPQSK